MKTVSAPEFLAGLEGVTDQEGIRLSPELLWPPFETGGFVYAMHVSGEIWRYQV